MDTNQLIQEYLRLFSGDDTAYAVGRPKEDSGKYEYFRVEEPLTEADVKRHLSGAAQLGVYCNRGEQCHWFAFDFDAPKGTELTPDDVYVDAVAQLRKFEELGLFVYLERSRSGKGWHLWGFIDEWMDALVVRDALMPHLLPTPNRTLDRGKRYPPIPKEDGRGLVLALPYNGKAYQQGNSAFVEPETREIIPPRDFLVLVRRNAAPVIAQMAEESRAMPTARTSLVGGGTREYVENFTGRPTRPLTGWLKAQSQYGCRFLHWAWQNRRTLSEPEWYAVIQQTTCFEGGREIAHLISRDYRGYNAAEVDEKYRHALESPPVGCATLREQFPHAACECDKAPYYAAKKTIRELVADADEPTEQINVADHLDEVFRIDRGESMTGIPYGIEGLNEVTSFRPGEVTYIGARSSMGKTAFAVDVAHNLVKQNIPVIFFSLETNREGLYERFLAREAEVDSRALMGERRDFTGTRIPLTADEKARLVAAKDALNARPLYLNFTAAKPDTVLREIERVLVENGIGFDEPYVVMFDYLQFGMKEPQESNTERVYRLSMEFKYAAKLLNAPFLILAQLNRAAEGGEPSITDFKDSGQIEQDADVAIIIWGERVEGQKAPRNLTIVKQRRSVSQITLHYLLRQDICRFEYLKTGGLSPRPDLLAAPLTMTSEDDDE